MTLVNISYLALADEYRALAVFLNTQFGMTINFSDIKSIRSGVERWAHLSPYDVRQAVEEFLPQYHDRVNPILGSQEAIASLRGHFGDDRLVMITERGESRKEWIKEYLWERFNRWEPKLYFAEVPAVTNLPDHQTKQKWCDDLDVLCSVETDWHTAEAIFQHATLASPLLFERPWNAFFTGGSVNPYSTWEEMFVAIIHHMNEFGQLK